MAAQISITVANARLDTVESTIGTAPTLEIRTGAAPANCAAADSGTVLATITLPSDWMAAASSGSKAKSGTWQDASADASGTPGHFRIKASSTVHFQGTAGVSSGDLSFDAAVTLGGTVTISTFTLTEGNS
jgi:hypothetical protein